MIEEIAKTPVAEVQTRKPVRVNGQMTLREVVTLMQSHQRGAVIVENDKGFLAGIFTERDLIVRVNHDTHDWHQTPVADVMTTKVQTLSARHPIAEAIRLMQQGTFRHLPIVDAEGRPQGIISIRDITAHIAEHFPQEFLNLPPDPAKEASEQWGG